MAIESPLFQSAMELFGHSFTHFNASEELDRKLVILHLANAVELILKDLVLDTGKSIYKSPKETISIHGAIKSLSESAISVPYLNKIELLVDERNALQHRFGSPNELTAIFYMNIAQDFFREILTDQYGQDYDETVVQFVDSKELHAYQMREPTREAELENLKKLANVHPLGALLSAMAYQEKIVVDFADSMGLHDELRRRPMMSGYSYRTLERYGLTIDDPLRVKLDETRMLRNKAAHGRKEPTKQEVDLAIEAIEEFERFLENVDREEFAEGVRVRATEMEIRDRKRKELRSKNASTELEAASSGKQTP